MLASEHCSGLVCGGTAVSGPQDVEAAVVAMLSTISRQ